MPITQFKSAFDVTSALTDSLSNRFESLEGHVAYYVTLNRPEVRSLSTQPLPNRFDSFRSGHVPQVLSNRFIAAALRTILVHNRLDILREHETIGIFRNGFDAVTLVGTMFPVLWNSVNDFPNGISRTAFRYDTCWSYRWQTGNRFQIISDSIARICYGRYPSRFSVGKSAAGFQPIRFDVIPQDFATHFRNRFDSTGQYLAGTPLHWQALVKPGWKIVAKNIDSGEVQNLGFIEAEAESHILENVFLPDGDYEIQVLSSSLFWKDTLDTNLRQISIRPGVEISPLPTIYNLRSSVSQGETTINWSANRSEIADCVFGVWYSSTSPVSADRPSDATVWYSPEMTEYQTSFKQNTPCYVAVAAIRTGNEPETGKVHELFLDWSNVKPRHPDDVVVFDKPLPVFDPAIRTVEHENSDLSLFV